MPLGRGIVEVFEAIPDRIEVSGHGPTWRVTGGSFESVVSYAREAFADAVVVARADRNRWWRRVTLTLTNDPALVAQAPPVDAFADADVESAVNEAVDSSERTEHELAPISSVLEEIFTHQEELRRARKPIPEQRRRRR